MSGVTLSVLYPGDWTSQRAAIHQAQTGHHPAERGCRWLGECGRPDSSARLLRIEAEARAPLEAQVAELRAALSRIAEWASFRPAPDAGALGPIAQEALAATDDPTPRVALRWLRSEEGQERLTRALRGMTSPMRSMVGLRGVVNDAWWKREAAAVVAALMEET